MPRKNGRSCLRLYDVRDYLQGHYNHTTMGCSLPGYVTMVACALVVCFSDLVQRTAPGRGRSRLCRVGGAAGSAGSGAQQAVPLRCYWALVSAAARRCLRRSDWAARRLWVEPASSSAKPTTMRETWVYWMR